MNGVIDMKKSDLKTGMIVKTRDGGEYAVFIDTCKTIYTRKQYKTQSFLINSRDRSWIPLDDYNEDMLNQEELDGYFDIMEIYIPNHPYSFQDVKYEYEDKILIWERNETKEEIKEGIKEVTMKDIEDKFRCKIKIVNKESKSEES